MTISLRADASRAVVVLDGVDRVAFNEDGSMELLTPAANPTGNKVMTVSQMPFSKVYNSPEQTMVASTTAYSLTHPLGTTPVFLQYMYVCKVAAAGYAVGDVVYPAAVFDSNAASSSTGWCTTASASTLYVRQGVSPLVLLDKTTGAVVSFATLVANFKLVVRAWA